MERETLFRCYVKSEKKMYEVHAIYFSEQSKNGKDLIVCDEEGIGEWRAFEDVELMEFTGKCDKNGKKIFEGDIVWDFAEEEYLVILWCQKLGRYVRSETIDVNKGLWYSFNDIFEEEGCEVKGNIYDNPELLEVNSGS